MLSDEDKQWITAKLEESEARSLEAMRNMQSELLRAFRNFSYPVEARLRGQKAVGRMITLRMDAFGRLRRVSGRRGSGETLMTCTRTHP
jgi:hypothetical protein